MLVDFNYSRKEIEECFYASNRINLDTYNTIYTSITNSSLECKQGSLFVPLIANRDGHEYILDAITRGASGFLYNENHPNFHSLPNDIKKKGIPVQDTWQALRTLANYHRKKFHPHIIALTGSSGKTTTKEFFRACLSHLPQESLVITEKNYNNDIGVAFTLFQIHEKTKLAVIEMGMNHRGEIERLSKMAEPHTVLITTIGSAHIENLGSPEAIAWEKSDITKGCRAYDSTPYQKNNTPILYVPENISFPNIVEENAKQHNVKVHYWKLPWINPTSPWKILKKDNQGYVIDWNGNQLKWNLPGDKLLSNLLGVFQVLFDLNIPIPYLIQGIQNYQPEGNRLKIQNGKLYKVINDTYNANPESMESSITIANQLKDNQPCLFILGDMKELGDFSEFYHRKIGDLLVSIQAQYLVTYGSNAQFILEEFLSKQKNPGNVVTQHFNFGCIPELVDWVYHTIPKGSWILVKGSRSMQMEQIAEKILDLD